MTFDDFTKKWNQRFVDYDGKYGYQCVDLMRQYIKEVLGVDAYKAIPAVNYAKNAFYNFPDGGTEYFTKVYNGPTNAPRKGDIVFFKTYPFLYGLAGHVAICNTADAMTLITFDQNWRTGTPCHFQKHSYRGCVGWLTPKK